MSENSNSKSWLSIISTSASILSISASIVYGGLQWASEKNAKQAEIELRAASEFLKLIEFAHARSGYDLSEACVGALSNSLKNSPSEIRDNNRIIEDTCVITFPVGRVSQEASMEVIASFGVRFPFLKEASIVSLNNLISSGISEDAAQIALARLKE